MALIARGSIQYGKPAEEEVRTVVIEDGAKVDPSLFKPEELEQLKAAGAVVEESTAEEAQELADEVRQLRAQLEEAQNKLAEQEAARTGTVPAYTVDGMGPVGPTAPGVPINAGGAGMGSGAVGKTGGAEVPADEHVTPETPEKDPKQAEQKQQQQAQQQEQSQKQTAQKVQK